MNLTETAINSTTMTNIASTPAIPSTTQGSKINTTTFTAILLGVFTVVTIVTVVFHFIRLRIKSIRAYRRKNGGRKRSVTEITESQTVPRDRMKETKCDNTQHKGIPRLSEVYKAREVSHGWNRCCGERYSSEYESKFSNSSSKTPRLQNPRDEISVRSNKCNSVKFVDECIQPPLKLSKLRNPQEQTTTEQSNDENGHSDFAKCAFIFEDFSDGAAQLSDVDSYDCKIDRTVLLGLPTNEHLDDGNEQNDLSNKYLDWNKILRYLAGHIQASKWQLFFNCLYGNTKLATQFNCQERIERVEMEVRPKYNDTETLLLEQFKSWKQAAGNNASPDVIEKTLIELGHMATLEEFKIFMRDLPYLDSADISVNDERHQSNDLFAANDQSSPRYELPPGSKLVKETHSKISLEIPPNTVGERFEPDGTSLFNFDMRHNAGLQEDTFKPSLTSPDEALKALTVFNKSDGPVQNECQVYQCTGVSSSENMPKRRIKCQHTCLRVKKINIKRKRKPKATKRLSRNSIEILIETYVQTGLEIKPDMHRFTTRKTIAELLKSNIKRDSALSLKYTEYCEIEIKSTRRGHTMYILYIGEEMHVLNPNTYNKLKLYAEHVRAKVVQRLKNMDENDYMFIDYNGSPLLKKHQDSSDDTASTSSSEDSETCPKIVD